MEIYKKIAELRKEVTYLQKEASNKAQGFNYVSSSQVLGAVRAKMDELGLILITSITGATLSDPLAGKKMYMTELHMLMTWVDVDTAERIEIPWYAQGADMSEKGVGKALTYGEKYFLLKQLNIATDKDDPDAYEAKQERKKDSRSSGGKEDSTEYKIPGGFEPLPKTLAEGMSQLKGITYDGDPMAKKYKSFVSEMGKFKKILGEDNYYECLKPFKKSIHVYQYQDMVKIFDLMRKAQVLVDDHARLGTT
jgi:hypothetical protein